MAHFVVSENGNHHNGLSASEDNYHENVRMVLAEDLALFDSSAYYTASLNGDIIGSLKVSLWDGHSILPVEKLFDVNCHSLPFVRSGAPVWHVGRLAISKTKNTVGSSLLKQLLTLAIYHICDHSDDGVMIAECDRKLLRVLNLFGIHTGTLAPSIEYLGSETIPVYSTAEWLRVFLQSNEHVDHISRLAGVDAFGAMAFAGRRRISA